MNLERPKSLSWLLSSIREDYVANKRHWSKPGFQALVVYRFGVWARHQDGLAAKVFGILYVLIHAFIRNLYTIEMHRFATIGRRAWIPHPAGVVIHHEVEIGDDCLIRQGATIGLATVEPRRKPYVPKIGNGVEIGAGAVIVGGVTVGDGARIGPNAVVMTDVPAGASAFAAPARVMKPLSSGDVSKESSTVER